MLVNFSKHPETKFSIKQLVFAFIIKCLLHVSNVDLYRVFSSHYIWWSVYVFMYMNDTFRWSNVRVK